MINKRVIGTQKELLASEFLRQNNVEILEMNFRCKCGEIDIIGMDNEYLVFYEVKFRSSTRYGYPEEAVNAVKQRKIYLASQYFMLKNNVADNTPIRYDIISILGNQIKHIRNAF